MLNPLNGSPIIRIDPYPNRLRIRDGELFMADGTDVREYLRTWAESQGIDSDEPLVLMDRHQAERLRYAALFSVVA